jgi:hypothetical protein
LSPDRALAKGTAHHKRPKHKVLCDARVHQLLTDDSDINSVKFALSQGNFEEELRDDRIYLIEKDLYHTPMNVSQSNAYKIDEGAHGRGLAGDIDAGYLDLKSYEIRNIELKSNGTIKPVDSIGQDDRTPSCVKKGRDTNSYIADLLHTFELNDNFHVPYNPSVEVWNGVIDTVNLGDVPRYSNHGHVIASEEAIQRAQNSEKLQTLNEGIFNNWLFGGGEIIREEDMYNEY